MKKILFGSAAAICTVVGFSSFKHANTNTTQYYVFQTDDMLINAILGPIPDPTIDVGFNNAMLFPGGFLGIQTLTTDQGLSDIGCSNNGISWCGVAFLHDQVVTIISGSNYKLLTNTTITRQYNEKFATQTNDD